METANLRCLIHSDEASLCSNFGKTASPLKYCFASFLFCNVGTTASSLQQSITCVFVLLLVHGPPDAQTVSSLLGLNQYGTPTGIKTEIFS